MPSLHKKLVLGLCALTALTAGTLIANAQQIVNAADYPGLLQQELACGTTPCILRVTKPQTITLAADHTLPPNIAVEFIDSGAWMILHSALTFSGEVKGPANRAILSGNIHGLHTARPEWFASSTPAGIPAEALRRAYAATVSNATINLNPGVYISPFFDPAKGNCGVPGIALDTPRRFIGSGRPAVNSEQNPTLLTGGTIIRGEVCTTTNIELRHLGIDTGAEVARTLFFGKKSFGLQVLQDYSRGQTPMSILEDISVLSNDVKDQHPIIFEGSDHIRIDHLWLWAPGSVHGLVLKSSDVRVHDYHCTGSLGDCLIIKSDRASDTFGYASNVSLDGVEIHALHHLGDTGGILLDGRFDNVTDVSLANVSESNTAYSIIATGNPLFGLRNITLRNWFSASEHCAHFDHTLYLRLESFHCLMLPSPSAYPRAMELRGNHMLLNNLTIGCGSNSGCDGASGIALGSPDTILSSIVVAGFRPPVCRLSGKFPYPACTDNETLVQTIKRQWPDFKVTVKVFLHCIHTRLFQHFAHVHSR